MFQYDRGPPGISGWGFHVPGYRGGGSGSGISVDQPGHFNQGHQGGYNQQPGQGNQQQQSGYQSNPKQLSSGQYHVFTTSLCKRGQKLHKRAVNAVEPAIPRYLRWSEQPIVWSREDHPPRVDNPVIWLWWWRLRLEGTSSRRYSWILYYDTFCLSSPL